MTTLRSLSIEQPSIVADANDTLALLAALAGSGRGGDWRAIVADSGVRRRGIALPPAQLTRLGDVGERNAAYARLAPELAERAARAALTRAGVAAADVDAVLVASSTGHLVPTLDLHLAARLELPPTTRCIALNDLGCVGALRAMALAGELRGHGVALIVAVELPSLWLPRGEASPADLRVAAVFGDGAGALILDGGAEARGPRLVAHRSVRWPDSLDARGAVQTGAGLRHLASPRLPRAVVGNLRRTVQDFLRAHDVALVDLGFVAVNPSELALARAIASHLELDDAAFALSRATWQQHGNTLAVGPLHLLRDLAERQPPRDGALGLLLAVGPGLTCDLTLLRWH